MEETKEKFLVVGQIGQTWRDAFRTRAISLSATPFETGTLGFKICWILWSADIWYVGILPFRIPFPLLKTILLCNIIVWVVLFATR